MSESPAASATPSPQKLLQLQMLKRRRRRVWRNTVGIVLITLLMALLSVAERDNQSLRGSAKQCEQDLEHVRGVLQAEFNAGRPAPANLPLPSVPVQPDQAQQLRETFKKRAKETPESELTQRERDALSQLSGQLRQQADEVDRINLTLPDNVDPQVRKYLQELPQQLREAANKNADDCQGVLTAAAAVKHLDQVSSKLSAVRDLEERQSNLRLRYSYRQGHRGQVRAGKPVVVCQDEHMHDLYIHPDRLHVILFDGKIYKLQTLYKHDLAGMADKPGWTPPK